MGFSSYVARLDIGHEEKRGDCADGDYYGNRACPDWHLGHREDVERNVFQQICDQINTVKQTISFGKAQRRLDRVNFLANIRNFKQTLQLFCRDLAFFKQL